MRVAVVGCGRHATGSIWPSLVLAGATIEAVAARRLDTATVAAMPYGVSRVFDDVTAMLESVDVDGVVVVVPPGAYAEVLSCCLDRGLPVFCEKPGAGSAAEAEDLAAQAREREVQVVVGYQKRFAPTYTKASECVAEAAFGPVTLASFRWTMGPMRGRVSMREWLFENPVHHLDLARHLCGEVSDLRAQAATIAGEYVVTVTGRLSTGGLLSLRTGTVGSWSQNNETVELYGVGSSVVCDNMDTCTLRPPERPELTWRPNYTVPLPANSSATTMGFLPELVHFVEVATQGVASVSTLDNAARTLRLAEEIAQLAELP